MTAPTHPVLFITVQYGNPSDTRAFLESVAALDDSKSCQVILVDNSPPGTSDPAFRVPDRYESPLEVLVPPKNLYYWGGAAFALDIVRQRSKSLPRWTIICNNDVMINQTDFLKRLAGIDPITFPIIGPAVISLTSHRDQNPMLQSYPGFLKRLKWRIYDVAYPIAKAMLATHRMLTSRAAERGKSLPGGRRRIYAPHGAFVILSSAFFERGGSLDTQVAMFAEELTLAETAVKLGMPIWHFPDLQVTHGEHSTTGAKLTPAKYALERLARRRYYNLRAATPGVRDWQL